MNSMYKRGTAIAAAVVLSLGLAACGGGGGGNLTTENRDLKEDLAAAQAAQAAAETARDAAQAAQAAAEAAQAAADAARMTAETERDAANARAMQAEADRLAAVADQMQAESDRDDAIAARNQAQADLGVAQTALGTAQANLEQAQMDLAAARADDTADDNRISELMGQVASLTTERDNAQADVNRLMGEVSTHEGTITSLNSEISDLKGQVATLTDERDKYKKMVEDAEEDRIAAENLDRVKGIDAAISGNRVSSTARDRTDAAGTALTGGSPVAASQMPFSTAADDGTTADAHGVSAKRDQHGAVTVSLPSALKSSKGTGTASADNPWTATSMMTRRLGGNTATKTDDAEQQVVVYTNIGAPTPRALASDFVSLTDQTVLVDTDDERGHVMPTSAPAAGSPAFAYAEDHQFGGTFRGFSGTYTCGSGGCTISRNADGDVVVSGNMNFKPDNLAAIYYIDDASYAYFGWWLDKPDAADGTHMVESFAGGNNVVADVATVTGTATYMGPAAGKYVTETYTAGKLVGGDAGHFTASATLNANFGDADVGDLAANMIGGMIDNFVLSSGNDASDWAVTLSDAAKGAQFGGTTNVTFGGATSNAAGNWRGAFYDAPAAGSPAGTAPGTIAGTFDAHTAGASLTGGFGATKQ